MAKEHWYIETSSLHIKGLGLRGRNMVEVYSSLAMEGRTRAILIKGRSKGKA
jgi:hypothetical protein